MFDDDYKKSLLTQMFEIQHYIRLKENNIYHFKNFAAFQLEINNILFNFEEIYITQLQS